MTLALLALGVGLTFAGSYGLAKRLAVPALRNDPSLAIAAERTAGFIVGLFGCFVAGISYIPLRLINDSGICAAIYFTAAIIAMVEGNYKGRMSRLRP